jgi:hypothetical protein
MAPAASQWVGNRSGSGAGSGHGAVGAVAESHFESSSAFLRGFGLDNRAGSTPEKVAELAGTVFVCTSGAGVWEYLTEVSIRKIVFTRNLLVV